MRNKTMTRSKNIKPVKAVTKKTPLSGKFLLSKKIEKKGKTKPGLKDTISLKKPATGTLNSKNAERYKKMIDNIEDGYFEVDIAGNFTFFNDSVCLTMGYSRKELMGMNTRQFTDKENAKKLFQAFNRVYKTGKPLKEIDWQIIRKDGNKRYIEASVSLLQDSSGKPTGFRGISRDVTERKLTEEKLRSEEQRFRALAEQSSDIIIFVNREGIITYENPAVERSLGLKAEERISASIFEFIHPDDLKFASNVFKTFALNTSPKDINSPVRQIRLRHHNGSWRTFETSGTKLLHDNIVESVIINLRDITERKRMEEELRREERLFRALAEQSSDIIVLMNLDEVITYVNPAVERALGFKPEERIGAGGFERVHPDDLKSLTDKFNILAGNTASPVLKSEMRLRHKDGSWRTFEAVGTNLVKNNAVESIIVNYHDITERKQAEEDLRLRESYLTAILENQPGLVWLKDKDSRFLTVNQAFADSCGKISAQELINKTDLDIWPKELAEKYRADDASVIKNMTSMIVEEPIFDRGETKWFETFKTPVIDKNREVIGTTGYARDITDRKRAEESLKEAELKFRTIFDSASDGILLLSVSEGKFSAANKTICNMLGYTNEELLNLGISDIHPPESVPFVIDQSEKQLKKEILIAKNIPVMKKDKTVFFADINSSLIISNGKKYLLGMFRDITERKLSEEEIKSAKAFLDMVIDMSPFAMWISDKEGTITRTNRSLCNTINLTENEVVGKYNVLKDLNLEIQGVMPMVRAVFEKHKPARFIIPWKAADASDVDFKGARDMHIDVSMFPILNSQGELTNVVCQWVDITERKQAEKELHESEELFRNLFQYHSAVKLIINPDTGSIIDANQAAVKYYGWPHEKITRMNIQDINILPPEEVKAAMEKVKIRKMTSFEFRHRRADGSIRDVEVFSSNIIAQGKNILHSIVHDSTERKKTETSLRESEIKYRILFESAGDAIFLLNKDIFIDCNQRALEMFHCTREQIIGQPPYRFSPEIQPDGRNSKEKAMEKNNATLGGQPQFFEWKHLRYDGTPFDAEISLNSINDRSKNYIQAICRDITDRKKAEDELKKYHEHLEALVRERTIKLEASNKELEAFSYSASHDLRAPIRTIDGFSQALLEDYEDKLDIQGKDYLIRIRSATRHMTELIEDLLQLSRITRTEMNIEKINLTRIARSVIDELQKSQPQRHVEIRIADGLEEIADLRLMRIVLENLLGNAWKFTGKQAKAVIEFGSIKKGGEKVYFIRDNGTGFDMAYADKLFAPFQRLHTEEEFPGTGIGLATVRRIIHRHGGNVRTEGAIGKGATFYFSLNEK